MNQRPVEHAHFRDVLSQYPTGVVVVTAMDHAGQPLGMTVGSFTSVSLDPPLIAFLPSKTSSSWGALKRQGERFCVNVLSASQENVCRAVAMRKQDKLAGIAWSTSPAGNPLIEGAVAWIDCEIEQIHSTGDHDLVIGRVTDLDVGANAEPLLFFRGGYGSFSPLSMASGEADLLSHLGEIDLARPHMEALAEHLRTEVTAIVRQGDDLVLAAAAGRTDIAVAPTRVGQRLPFMAPIGSCFVAWGDETLLDRWIAPVVKSLGDDNEELGRLRGVPRLVRERGYAIAVGHAPNARLESAATGFNAGDPDITPEVLRDTIVRAMGRYNQADVPHEDLELRSLSAPVFGTDGEMAFMLTLWGRWERVSPAELGRRVELLRRAAEAATKAIARSAEALVSAPRDVAG